MSFLGMLFAFIFSICFLAAVRAISQKNDTAFWIFSFGVSLAAAGLFWFMTLFFAK